MKAYSDSALWINVQCDCWQWNENGIYCFSNIPRQVKCWVNSRWVVYIFRRTKVETSFKSNKTQRIKTNCSSRSTSLSRVPSIQSRPSWWVSGCQSKGDESEISHQKMYTSKSTMHTTAYAKRKKIINRRRHRAFEACSMRENSLNSKMPKNLLRGSRQKLLRIK